MNRKPLEPARAGASEALAAEPARAAQMDTEIRSLFHRLNNQLGVILAHAELLEARAADEASRTRAAQVVSSVLDAMGTAKDIRRRADADRAGA